MAVAQPDNIHFCFFYILSFCTLIFDWDKPVILKTAKQSQFIVFVDLIRNACGMSDFIIGF